MNGQENGFWPKLFWAVIFLGCYAYSIAVYGMPYGAGLGWIPAGIVATVAIAVWMLVSRVFGDLLWLVAILGIVIVLIYEVTGPRTFFS